MATNQGLNVQLSADASQFVASLQAAINAAQAAASGLADPASSMNALTNAANSASAASNALAGSLNAAAAAAQNAGSAINAPASTLNFLSSSTQRLNVSIANFSRDMRSTSPVMRGFANDARNGRLSFVGLNGAVSNAGRGVRSQLVPPVQEANRAANGLGQSMNALNNIIRDSPYGFNAIANNITELADALLGASLAATAATFGISLLVTGATALIQKYGSLSAAYEALFVDISASEQAQKALAKAQQEGIDNADKELIHLKGLYDATQNLNIPLRQRNKIIDDLQKQYPEYFGNLSNEAILAGQAETAYKNLRNAIIAVAQSKAIEDELVTQAKDARELKKEYADLVRLQLKFANIAEEARKNAEAVDADFDPSGVGNAVAALKKHGFIKEMNTANAVVKSLTNQLIDNRNKQADLATVSNSLADEQQKLAEKFNAVTTGFTDGSKKTKTVADVLKVLHAQLAAVDYQAQLTGASFDKIAADKIGALQSAFDELVELGLKPASPELKDISRQINLLAAATIGSVPIQTKNLLAFGKAFQSIKVPNLSLSALQDLLKLTDRSSGLKLNAPIVPLPEIRDGAALENLDKFTKQFKSKVSDTQKQIQAEIDKKVIKWGNFTTTLGQVAVDLGSQLRGFAAEAAAGLGEVIGGIVSGGASLAQSLGRLVGVMGQFIVDFGKSLIEAATLRIIAEKTLFANPYVALAAGVAAVAIGSVLKNSFPSFAEGGGMVGAPGLAMIGDNPGREEYVIPSEVLDKIGGGRQSVRVYGRLRGQDIYYANERAKRVKARIN